MVPAGSIGNSDNSIFSEYSVQIEMFSMQRIEGEGWQGIGSVYSAAFLFNFRITFRFEYPHIKFILSKESKEENNTDRYH